MTLGQPAYSSLADLPAGAVVGTFQPAPPGAVGALRPDLRIEPLRGNLDTRLRKLDAGEYDAIVLAAAGLKRLGLASAYAPCLPPADAARRGPRALAIEVCSSRSDLLAALAPAG